LHLLPWQRVIWQNIADGSSSPSDNFKFYLTVYAILAGANSFLTFIRSFLFAYGGIEAAVILHRRLLDTVLKVTCEFAMNPLE
jgi:ABC-type multidrug transport system fused ATPase/permease subunit